MKDEQIQLWNVFFYDWGSKWRKRQQQTKQQTSEGGLIGEKVSVEVGVRWVDWHSCCWFFPDCTLPLFMQPCADCCSDKDEELRLRFLSNVLCIDDSCHCVLSRSLIIKNSESWISVSVLGELTAAAGRLQRVSVRFAQKQSVEMSTFYFYLYFEYIEVQFYCSKKV